MFYCCLYVNHQKERLVFSCCTWQQEKTLKRPTCENLESRFLGSSSSCGCFRSSHSNWQAVHYGLPTLKQSLRISAEATAGPMPATPSVSPAPAASSMPSAPCPVIVAGEDPDLNLR